MSKFQKYLHLKSTKLQILKSETFHTKKVSVRVLELKLFTKFYLR